MFSPTQEYIRIPVVPHCGAGSRFDCSNVKSSFVKHRHDRYVTGLEVRSGSFLEDERVGTDERSARVITAAHTLDRNRLHHTYAIMNLAQSGFAWPVGEGDDHMRIEPRFVLRVSKVVNCEDTSHGPDWAVLEVEPILLDSQGIPKHDAFELATYEPRQGARITVPAHPRGLPLKLADGVITSEIGSSEGLRGIFDVAGGSSGSPVLDEQGRVVGINRVQATLIHGPNGLAERTCEFPSKDKRCQGQPLTPATRIAEHLSRPPKPRDCSLVQ